MSVLGKRVCICGGGNIAHALAAVLSRDDKVCVLTRNPDKWNHKLQYQVGDDATIKNAHLCATSNIAVVAEAEYVFVAVPRFAITDLLHRIDSFLHSGQVVMFVPAPAGMERIVERYAERGVAAVGFQRVPNVARIKEYGHLVWIGDSRPVLKLAFSTSEIVQPVSEYVTDRFCGKVEQLLSFLSFTFSNSNPLLHPSRLVALLKGGANGVYHKCPYFYAEWTDESSELYQKADADMFRAFCHYSKESAMHDYESALDHYESSTPHEMTNKMRSIASLRSILAPWKQRDDGLWYPDFNSRYFTEDIPYGTRIIQWYAHDVGIEIPTIDYIVDFINNRIQKGC